MKSHNALDACRSPTFFISPSCLQYRFDGEIQIDY
jgi:hypothetical protein